MTDQGPTTVGSIVGKLRMDREQWILDVAKTKQEARELGALEPDIHIDTNAATAISQLGAAAAAADALGAKNVEMGRKSEGALTAVDRAAARAAIAQMRLTEARDKGGFSASRMAALELAAAEASSKLQAAQAKLADTQSDVADKTVKANEANRTSVTRVGAIATAIALLVPLLAPVGGAAVGLGGAFLGMGAAGVLALFGIHSEMQRGTSTGQAYRQGLDTLKGSMQQLSQTAAVAMLSSFRRGVAEISGAMPFLNKQVGDFSGLLGQSGANALSGTITALRVLNPLFLTAGVYLRSLTAGFKAWTEGRGIEEFGGYALSALPQVVDVLGKLASMVMHILEALAPLGAVGMAVLSGIATAVNAIPVEILSQLIVTITWGAVAFKAWGFIAPMLATIATQMGAVGAATAIATGPIGWAVAGLAALAGVFAVIIASNTGATRAMQDYTAAVQADNGAVGENIRLRAAQKLQDSGALDAAKKLGISLELVTDATLGQKDAVAALAPYMAALNGDQSKLNEISKETGVQAITVATALQTLKDGIESNGSAISGEIDRYKQLQDALTVTAEASREQQWADEAAAAAAGVSTEAIRAAREGQQKLGDATGKATAEMYLQNDAAGLLRQSLDLLNGKQLSAAEAQNQFESQLTRIPQFTDSAAASLDGMSESAVDNRGRILDLIKASQDAAVAYRDQGASSDEARQKMIDGKQAIIDQMAAMGANRDEVTRYVDGLYSIPATVPKTKVEVDTETATAQVQGLLSWISQRVATVQVRATLPDLNGAVSGSGRPGFAMGGTIPGLAGGGSGGTVLGPGTAGSDTAGIYRLGRGEEVVSNVFGQADRNRALLKAINAGYTPSAGSARSFASEPAPTASTGGTVVQVDVNVTVLKNEDPRVAGAQIGRAVKDALAGVSL